jgi:hypothetical protein
MIEAKMYCLCLHDEIFNEVNSVGYIPVGLGEGKFSKKWLRDNINDNISFKNKYYGEYTFHYWFWKNIFPTIKDNQWIGFCSYRELWGNKNKINENSKFKDVVLNEVPKEWENFDTIIGEHIFINNLKFSKLIKRGIWSLIRNPLAIFKSRRNIRFQFDMWHGNGNLDKAIDLLDDENREDFRKFTRKNISFNRGNMFVCRSKEIINSYYSSIFPWLDKCEKVFGFDLEGYGKTRMYTFLAERYLSYWFNKYTKPLLWPVIFFDIIKKNNL